MKPLELIGIIGTSLLVFGVTIAHGAGFKSEEAVTFLMLSSLIIAIGAALARMAD